MGLFHFFFINRVSKIVSKTQEGQRRVAEGEGRVQRKRERPRSGNLLKGMSASKIPFMIDGLESRSETKRENCYHILKLYTGCDLGPDPKRWRDWYELNRDRPAHEWWADRLGERGYNTYGLSLDRQVEVVLKAMRDSDPLVRRAAARLLGHITGTAVKFAPDGTPKMRKWQLDKWLAMYEKRRQALRDQPEDDRQ